MAEEISSVDTQNNEPINDVDSTVEFQQEIINPASKAKFDWADRDLVLGNIDKKDRLVAVAAIELIELLYDMGQDEVALLYEADLKALFVTSRSVDGFATKSLNTARHEFKGLDEEEKMKQKRKLFGFRRR